MTKISPSTKTTLVLAVFIISAISVGTAEISDKRLCYDPQCSEPISLAKTLLRYNSNDPRILSFSPSTELKVFSKEAGKRTDLWGVEINGKRGYAPKTFIREYKVLKKNLSHEVPTETFENSVDLSNLPKADPSNLETSEETNESITDSIQSEPLSTVTNSDSLLAVTEKQTVPDLQGVTPSYEVIDGTIIPLSPNESPQPSYTTQIPPVTRPALPDEQPVPSYTTQIPPVTIPAVADEQPILSILPNPASHLHPFVSSFSNVQNPQLIPKQQPIENNEQAFVAASTLPQENKIKQSLGADALGQSVPQTIIAEAPHLSHTDPLSGNILLPEENGGAPAQVAPIETVPNSPLIEAEASIRKENIEGNIVHDLNTGSITPPEVPIQNNEAEITKEVVKEDVVVPQDSSKDPHHETENVNPILQTEQVRVGQEIPIVQQVIDEQLDSEDASEEAKDTSSSTNENHVSDYVPVENQTSAEEHNNVEANVLNEDLVQPQIAQGETVEASQSSFYMFNEQVDRMIQRESAPGKSDVEEQVLDEEESTEFEMQGAALSVAEPIGQHDHEGVVDNSMAENIHSLNAESGEVNVSLETRTTDENGNLNFPVTDVHNPNESPILSQEEIAPEQTVGLDERFSMNRNLLNVDDSPQYDNYHSDVATTEATEIKNSNTETSLQYGNHLNDENMVPTLNDDDKTVHEQQEVPPEVCNIDDDCVDDEEKDESNDNESTTSSMERSYWETVTYLFITASSALIFSLGYYYIENTRRDSQLVGRINKLEKELLVTTKECMILDESLKNTKSKLTSIEDESFGSNEMVASLKSELDTAQNTKIELEDQIATLEKELESATEAGLELERMLREILESQSDDNPLAQSVEDLQARLNAQQATNETLTKSLTVKKQENEALSAELAANIKKCQQLEVEMRRVTEELEVQISAKNKIEQTLTENINQLEIQINEIAKDKAAFRKELMGKEMEVKDLWEVVNKVKSNDLDFEKLCNVSHVKAEAKLLLEERDELKVKLSEVEGAHQLLADHMKLVQEDIASLTEQYRLAEKEKKDAETRLEVLSKFFNEKEAQRQKEEAKWLQKQGEVMSTVERIQTMQSEIENYKQQIEMLKREILDQEREYKNQISTLENKTHEQWVVARQNERRLEESKAEASQLRNRLTLVEKNINEVDSDSKLHRLETNGETATSPQLYMGAESSSSPIMFTGSSGVPPPHPSYMYGPPLPPFLPPPPHPSAGGMYDISQRPPPLGGRLSSPPPLPLHPPLGRYDDAGSPPPPMSPPLHPPYRHRSPPPPFSNDRIHSPLPPLLPPLGTSLSWGDETLPAPRNSGYHPHQREHRLRNHKGSLHSSGESLDKSHHGGKV